MYVRSFPYAWLSREEHLKKIYEEELTPAEQAAALKMADEQGLTLMELLRAIAADFDAAMADPVRREEWLSLNEELDRQRAMPFGSDPRLHVKDSDQEGDE